MLNRANLITLLVATLVGLLLLEIGLRIATPYPVTSKSNWAFDSQLGYVLDSNFPGVDDSGFRNDGLDLDDADIAVIGDSHAYGIHVFAADSFPAVLARRTGKKVYNFGVSSYGIYQYKVLLDRIAESPVNTSIVALFIFNDLALYLCRVTMTEFWEEYAALHGLQLPDCSNFDKAFNRAALEYQGLEGTATWQIASRVLNRIGREPAEEAELMLVSTTPRVLSSRERVESIGVLSALDNPAVAINFENSLRFFREAKEQYDAAGKNLLFLLIPSRTEVLHANLVQRQATLSPEFEIAVNKYLATKSRYIEFFEKESIDYFDALPYVLEAARESDESGEPFYDGTHPLEEGYAAYADAAQQGLINLQSAKFRQP